MRTFMRTSAMLMLLQAVGASCALAGEVVKVHISDLAFAPADITGRVGDTVEWVNGDFIDHTATAKSGDWDITIPAGTTGQVQLTRAATIEYFCRFHPGMTGTIHVAAGSAPN